ncbi:protein phosphatase manganese magnesium aspartate binding site [Nannochloropsis oceanica]
MIACTDTTAPPSFPPHHAQASTTPPEASEDQLLIVALTKTSAVEGKSILPSSPGTIATDGTQAFSRQRGEEEEEGEGGKGERRAATGPLDAQSLTAQGWIQKKWQEETTGIKKTKAANASILDGTAAAAAAAAAAEADAGGNNSTNKPPSPYGDPVTPERAASLTNSAGADLDSSGSSCSCSSGSGLTTLESNSATTTTTTSIITTTTGSSSSSSTISNQSSAQGVGKGCSSSSSSSPSLVLPSSPCFSGNSSSSRITGAVVHQHSSANNLSSSPFSDITAAAAAVAAVREEAGASAIGAVAAAAQQEKGGKEGGAHDIKEGETDTESSSTWSNSSGSAPPSPTLTPSYPSSSSAATAAPAAPAAPAAAAAAATERPVLVRPPSGSKMFLPHEASELEVDQYEEDGSPSSSSSSFHSSSSSAAAAAALARATAGQLLRAYAAPTPPPPSSEDHIRVHSLTLKELALVDENPSAMLAPSLTPPSVPGSIVKCTAGYGKSGRGKAYRGPAQQVRGPVVVYGEDVLAEAELLLPASVGGARVGGAEGREGGQVAAVEAPKWVRAMGVFDGHGMHGREAARVAAERYVDDMRRTTMQTLGALMAGDVDKVRKVEFDRYRLMEAHLDKELGSPTGGTTATTVQFLACGGKAWGVVSNVGDSPVLLVDNATGRVQVLTGRHSWDNPEERQKYLDRCQALGVVPREVVYGRINCGGMRMTDAKGGEEPLMMYREGTSEVCVETREWLCKQVEKRYRNSIGGSQSTRRMVLEKLTVKEDGKEGGEWEVYKALEEHAHTNWGATILVDGEGKIQMSRSLGDSQEKKTAYIWAEPDVSVWELGPGEDWSVIACSDGVGDLWYFHELGAMAADFFAGKDQEGSEGGREGEVQELATLILEQTIERGEVAPGYGIAPRVNSVVRGEGLKRPLWDDLSVHCARIQT